MRSRFFSVSLGFGEDAVEILFGLADVLVDNRSEIHRVQVKAELAGEHFGRHRLARARWAGEQCRQSAPAGRWTAHLPDIEHLLAIARPRQQLLELCHGVGWQHQVGEVDRRLDAARQALEASGVLGAGSRLELLFVQGDLSRMRFHARRPRRSVDLLRGKAKLGHRAGEVDASRRFTIKIPSPELGALKRVGNGGFADERDVTRPAGIPAAGADQHDQGRHLRKGADRREPAGNQDFDRTSHDAGSGKASLAGAQCGHGHHVILVP